MSVANRTVVPLVDDGFALLPSFLGPGDLSVVRRAVGEVLAAPLDSTCERPNNTLAPLRWDSPIVSIMLSDPDRMGRLASVTAATDLRWISGYVSIKDPHSPPLWWHQDWWCCDHPVSFRREPAQVAVLCYLTDTDAHNGALRVLPGSHARSAPIHAALPDAHSDESGTLSAPHEAMRDQPGQVTLALRAGDAAVLDYRLLHGTHPNLSERRRDCVLLSFTPGWRHLPADVRGHLIRHPALPSEHDSVVPGDRIASLLPDHHGPRSDLPLNRKPPSAFVIG
jgi:Phytanoyl-CoA dioxygenase (PhyH)